MSVVAFAIGLQFLSPFPFRRSLSTAFRLRSCLSEMFGSKPAPKQENLEETYSLYAQSIVQTVQVGHYFMPFISTISLFAATRKCTSEEPLDPAMF